MNTPDDDATVGLGELRAEAVARLVAAGVPTPDVDADLLIGHELGLGRGALHSRLVVGGDVPADAAAGVRTLVARRVAREPLQHITGTAPFRAFEVEVGPGVLVPRPETEVLAGLAIDALRAAGAPEPIAVDLGTGTGVIAIALAREVPHARVYGVELSPDALPWARRNAEALAGESLTIFEGDLADAALLADLDGMVDVVVSNPPYVPLAEVPLDAEVARHDPAIALYAGEDGLAVMPGLIETASRLLRPGGMLLIEHAEQHPRPLAALLTAGGWRAIAHHRDLVGRDRFTTALRP